MVEKKTGLDWVLDILNTALLILIGLACLYPFWYVVCASFSDANEFLRHDFVLLLKPLKFSLEAYQYCITDRILVGYRNTLFYVVAGTAISMFLTFLGAYALSRKGWMGKRLVTLMIMFTMYFSGGIIAIYLWVQQLHMIDTVWAILLPTALSTYNLIVMRTAFANVPESLIEAARLDGASEFTCLFRIVIPLSQATIAVVLLFYAVSRWNDWVPWPISPASSKARTAKVTTFPSTAVTSASARTSSPTGVAETCSMFSAVPTVVWPSASPSATASHAAPSISATMQGVA